MSEIFPLEINHLDYEYPQRPLFRDINIALKKGEFLSILGASGCGKTTLLRAIAGLVTPQQGTILIAGNKVLENGKETIAIENRRVGFVFQDYALFPYQTVQQNIAFGLTQKNKQEKLLAQSRVAELLDLVGMQAFADRYPSDLSGGQQQRVAIARALAPKPALLLLDEPFANVDTAYRQILSEQLQKLMQHERMSVILVTHDRYEALALADHVAVLEQQENGTVLRQHDTPERVYHCPINKAVAQMVGLVSFVPAVAKGDMAETALGNIPLASHFIGEGWVAIRPEMAVFKPETSGSCKVIARSFHGHCYRLTCQTSVGEILVEWNYLEMPAFGQCGEIEFIQPCWFLQE